MKQKRWGECECGKWGDAPANFDERIHFMKCECGKAMFMTIFDPKEVCRRDSDKIVPGLMKHGEKLS